MANRKNTDNPVENTETTVIETAMDEFETPLLRYAARLLNNSGEAQDVVQNSFLKLVKAFRRGAFPQKSTRSWLYRVVHNEALDHIRRQSRMKSYREEKRMEIESLDSGHREDLSTEQKTTIVMEHISTLDETSRQVLLLRLEEGLSYKEIARITNRTVGNVGCILHNAVRQLSDELVTAGMVCRSSNMGNCENNSDTAGGLSKMTGCRS